MKSSRFNSIIKLNSLYYVLFNSLTEKYFLFKSEHYKDLTSVLNSAFFSDTFSEKENIFYDKCMSGKFLIDDNDDELLNYKEKFKKYNDSTKLNITLYNNEHNSNSFNFWLDLTNRINIFIQKSSHEYEELEVSWFVSKEYTNFKFLSILTNRFSKICRQNNCTYSASILISDTFPEHLENLLQKLIVKSIEIDLSSCDNIIAANVSKNINLIFKIKKDMKVKLIIDINDDNVLAVNSLLNYINYEYRNNINLLFYNHLKFSPELFLYKMYLKSINLGYNFSYLDTFSSFISSQRKNSYCIDSNLNISSCVAAAKSNDFFGSLNDDGSLNIFNKPVYFRYLNVTSVDNYKCTFCPELPICLSNYPYYRSVSRFLCIKDLYNDLSLEQKIKLKIFSDTTKSKKMPQII